MSETNTTVPGPLTHTCYLCGAPNAAWGFGWPGPRKDRPDDMILWACALHRHEVELINDRRVGRRPVKADATL